MSLILNIRGTNGAGKSTVVRTLMEQFGADPVRSEITGKVVAYKLLATPITYVLGRYETACGGADTISSFGALGQLIMQFASRGNVLFEGSLFSTVFKGPDAIATSLPSHNFTFARLDTPVEICVQRVLARRAEAGNTDPFDPSGVIDKHRGVLASTERLREAGWNVQTLDHRNAVAEVCALLGLHPSVGTAPVQKNVPGAATEKQNELAHQLMKLNARWAKIASRYADSLAWDEPSDSTWKRLLSRVPFVVLYEDVLRRLNQFSGHVQSSAVCYLEMIVDRNGKQFAAERGCPLPTRKFFDDEEDVDDFVPAFVSHKTGTVKR